jgi:anti-sigma factor RsiW
MTGHDEVFETLSSYALDAVEPEDRATIAAHVETCATCRAELASIQTDVAALDREFVAPPSLWTRIRDEFRRRSPD